MKTKLTKEEKREAWRDIDANLEIAQWYDGVVFHIKYQGKSYSKFDANFKLMRVADIKVWVEEMTWRYGD